MSRLLPVSPPDAADLQALAHARPVMLIQDPT